MGKINNLRIQMDNIKTPHQKKLYFSPKNKILHQNIKKISPKIIIQHQINKFPPPKKFSFGEIFFFFEKINFGIRFNIIHTNYTPLFYI